LQGSSPILVYRIRDYAAAVRELRSRGVVLHELEIPHRPCASFTTDGGHWYAVYELARLERSISSTGRIDP
jgi:hypothetical protein